MDCMVPERVWHMYTGGSACTTCRYMHVRGMSNMCMYICMYDDELAINNDTVDFSPRR